MAVPTGLALWLVGLGIPSLFGRPRQRTDNAVVEGSHGVLAGWVEPHPCQNGAELARRLTHYARIQREVYPVEPDQTHLRRFPALVRNPRRYQPEQEAAYWDLARVLDYVAGYTFSRMVDKNGRLTRMTLEYSLGRQYRCQRVTAQLNPQQKQSVIKDRYGEVIGHFPALQLNCLTLAGMTLTYKHFKAKLNRARNAA
jgi:hypothetical protein